MSNARQREDERTPKTWALDVLRRQPDDITWYLILYHLSVCEKLDAGLRSDQEEPGIPDEELLRHLRLPRKPLPETRRDRAIEEILGLKDDCTWEKLIYELWCRKELEEAIEHDIRTGVYDHFDEDDSIEPESSPSPPAQRSANVSEIESAIHLLNEAAAAIKSLKLPRQSDPLYDDLFDQLGRAMHSAEQAKMYLENARDCVRHSLPLRELRRREEEQTL